jgi:hypothetical protein
MTDTLFPKLFHENMASKYKLLILVIVALSGGKEDSWQDITRAVRKASSSARPRQKRDLPTSGNSLIATKGRLAWACGVSH